MNELALFAGAGGGVLGGKLLGWRTVCAVERDAYAASVLAQRQNDGCLEPFPIWSDVCSFDGKPWRGIVDVVSGGFPCQDISLAGKGGGIEGSRSGLWSHMARIIRDVRPKFVLVENSPTLVIRGLGRVLGDLAQMGYDARWGVLGVGDAGGMHQRNRIWIVAYPNTGEKRVPFFKPQAVGRQQGLSWCKDFRRLEDLCNRPDLYPSPLLRNYHGIPFAVDRVAACGNAQHPAVVKLAWETLKP